MAVIDQAIRTLSDQYEDLTGNPGLLYSFDDGGITCYRFGDQTLQLGARAALRHVTGLIKDARRYLPR